MIMILSVQRAFFVTFFFCLYLIFGVNLLPQPALLFHRGASIDDARCAAFPDPGNMAVAVRTAAAQVSLEQLNRVATIFHCLRPDRLLLFSDLDQEMGPYKLHNILSEVHPDLLHSHHDFRLYRQQQKLAKQGLNIKRSISETNILSSEQAENQEEAIKNLDKYKFLHMVRKAWELQPDKEWYVFADASSYYVWPGLVRYLRDQDPSLPRFLAKATRIGESDLDVGDGETGIILSGVAVKALATSASIAHEWDRKTSLMASGQHVLATALHSELNLTLTNTWPLMLGDGPGEIPFQTNLWCEPVISLNNLSSELVLRLLKIEQSLKYDVDPKSFVAFKDLFAAFNATSLGVSRQVPKSTVSYTYQKRWYNMADRQDPEFSIDWHDKAVREHGLVADLPENPNRSPDDCAMACAAFRDCMQFSHMAFDSKFIIDDKLISDGGLCHLSKLYRFGAYRGLNQWEDDGHDGHNAPNSVLNTQEWTAGWSTQRMNAWATKMDRSCAATL